MSAPSAPLLRVLWPRQLLLPAHLADNEPLELVGWRSGGQAVQEVVITGTRSPTASPDAADAAVVGTLLQQPPADVADASTSHKSPCFLLLPTAEPGGLLPVLLPAAATRSATPGPATRRRRQQAAEQQQEARPCQVVLYDSATRLKPEGSRGQGQQRGSPGRGQDGTPRRRLWAALASHLAGALLAALLLVHWRDVTAAAVLRSNQLAGFVSGQLTWFASSQPAGVKLHRQLAELLSATGLQYAGGMRRLLSGRGHLVARGAAGVLAAMLLCGGLQPGMLALEWLLWAAGLPLALPYAAMAAALRWQLHCTSLMWRVMRGKQQMTPLRHRLAALMLARWRVSSSSRCRDAAGVAPLGGGTVGSGGALFDAPQAAAVEMASFPRSPGSGLKQLSGSMLLFMPLLLLLPTTAWYYGFALVLHVLASVPRATVRLARQLAAEDPLGAALGQLLKQPSGSLLSWGSSDSSSPNSGLDAHYTPLDVRWPDGTAAEVCWMQQAAAAMTYIKAECRQLGPWQAALQAALRAWQASGFASQAPAAVVASALRGRPLFLGMPVGWAR